MMVPFRTVLFAHGGCENHGCEALVRSTSGILNRAFGENALLELITGYPEIDRKYMGDICSFHALKPNRRSLDFLRAFAAYKLKGDYTGLDAYPYRSVIRSLGKPSLALSIGGDNYCYGYTAYYAYLNRLFRKAGYKTVLWGCSINEEALKETGAMKDLRAYRLITARESLTFNLLKEKGLDNVELFPDPAFTMAADTDGLPEGWPEDRMVGLNLSPMIQDNETVSGSAMENYRSLVRMLLNETDYQIALIPHVVWKHSDDRKPLRALYEEFRDTGRVVMVEDRNAERLKGVISKCRFLVAARTHASIAGYSTCVPTLVVGYSVKAKGIARDIFGSYEDYVLPVQELKDPEDLSRRFRWLMEHEEAVRTHLQGFMPAYIEKAWQAGEALKNV